MQATVSTPRKANLFITNVSLLTKQLDKNVTLKKVALPENPVEKLYCSSICSICSIEE